MSKPTSNSYGTQALMAWLAALALFLLWLGWTLMGGTPTAGNAPDKDPVVVGQNDVGTVLDGLPEQGELTMPDLPFDASQEYVLALAGRQGFYQHSFPDEVWTLSYPAPRMNAQLIKRGPPVPQRITQGVNIIWELEPNPGLKDGSSPRKGQMEAVNDTHFQTSIPLNSVRSGESLNLYSVVRVRAEEEASGRLLAESAAILAVAPGFGCAHCHGDAGTAILEVHDRHMSTNLLEQHAQGDVVACRSCHVGMTLGQDMDQAQAGRGLSLSAAVHGWHAAYLSGRAEDVCMTCHVSLVRTGEEQSAPQPMFARDFHVDRGLNCVRCHGFMEDHALALLKAEQEAGQAQATRAMGSITPREASLDTLEGRLPWLQQPDCTSCHDFSAKPDLDSASAFNKWTDRSEGTSGLFSERTDFMDMLTCITCHGAPHAVYPARNPFAEDIDNIPPLQYQEQAAPLGRYGNCALCHGESKDYFAHHPQVERSATEIHTPPGAELIMPAVRFSHQAHVSQVNCTTCHHRLHEDGKSLLCTSSGCHDSLNPMLPAEGDAEPKPDPRYFYNAFHGPFPSCFACHTESLAAGEPAGPTDCKACHQAPSTRWITDEASRDASLDSDR